MTAAVTGNRPNKIDGDWTCTSPSWDRIREFFAEQLTDLNIDRLLCGMALGVDQVAAEAALACNVPFVAVVPFRGQESRWPPARRSRYRELVAAASEEIVVSDGDYAVWKMHVRNQWMIDRCGLLLAVWDGTKGGTQSCYDYAQSRVPILRLHPHTGAKTGSAPRQGAEPSGLVDGDAATVQPSLFDVNPTLDGSDKGTLDDVSTLPLTNAVVGPTSSNVNPPAHRELGIGELR